MYQFPLHWYGIFFCQNIHSCSTIFTCICLRRHRGSRKKSLVTWDTIHLFILNQTDDFFHNLNQHPFVPWTLPQTGVCLLILLCGMRVIHIIHSPSTPITSCYLIYSLKKVAASECNAIGDCVAPKHNWDNLEGWFHLRRVLYIYN